MDTRYALPIVHHRELNPRWSIKSWCNSKLWGTVQRPLKRANNGYLSEPCRHMFNDTFGGFFDPSRPPLPLPMTRCILNSRSWKLNLVFWHLADFSWQGENFCLRHEFYLCDDTRKMDGFVWHELFCPIRLLNDRSRMQISPKCIFVRRMASKHVIRHHRFPHLGHFG